MAGTYNAPSIDEYLRKRLMPVEGAIPHVQALPRLKVGGFHLERQTGGNASEPATVRGRYMNQVKGGGARFPSVLRVNRKRSLHRQECGPQNFLQGLKPILIGLLRGGYKPPPPRENAEANSPSLCPPTAGRLAETRTPA
jgi:hypothetical protein